MSNSKGEPISYEAFFREYDALPQRHKAILAAAPVNLRCRGLDNRTASQLISDIANTAAIQTLRTYGSDHPCFRRLKTLAEARA